MSQKTSTIALILKWGVALPAIIVAVLSITVSIMGTIHKKPNVTACGIDDRFIMINLVFGMFLLFAAIYVFIQAKSFKMVGNV
jgi:hypothetical protein